MRRWLTLGVVLELIAVGMSGCGYFEDLAGPVPLSHGSLTLEIRDSYFDVPVLGAEITIGDMAVITDSSGKGAFTDFSTGKFRCTVSCDRFWQRDTTVSVTLSGQVCRIDLTRMPRPPDIESIVVHPNPTRSRDDTVSCVFTLTDSTGGIFEIELDRGDGKRYFKSYFPSQTVVVDSLKWSYDSAASYSIGCTVRGGDTDSTVLDLPGMRVSPNQRPVVVGAMEVDSFFANREGFLLFDALDPDGSIAQVMVDWGDGSVDTSHEVEAIYWHTFQIAATTFFPITVTLEDNEGAQTVSAVTTRVRTLNAPRLDPDIYYNPLPPLTPLHDSVTIGVNIREVEEYVAGITWIINEGGGSAAVYFSGTYNTLTGHVELPGGSLFSCTIPTANLVSENVVKIRVTDNFGLWNELTGTFSILGK